MSDALALTLRRSLFPALNESISEPTGRRHDRHSFHSHADPWLRPCRAFRSEEHTSELPSLMRISSSVFCLKKKRRSLLHVPNISARRAHSATYTLDLNRK